MDQTRRRSSPALATSRSLEPVRGTPHRDGSSSLAAQQTGITRLILLLCAVVAISVGCGGGGGGGGTPTQPTPTTLLSIEAVPAAIGVFGQSQIQVLVRRTDGTAVARATITLSSTLGNLDAVTVTTDEDGGAVTTLRGNGAAGTASVVARLNDGLTAETSVQIGGTAPSVQVRAQPEIISSSGSSVILIQVTNADGSVRQRDRLRLSTTLGRLADTNLTTDDAGAARTDFSANPGETGTALVTVQIESSGEAGEVQIEIDDGLTLSITATPSTIPVDGSSTVEVSARASDGALAGSGILISLTTDIGRFDDANPVTNELGVAATNFRADGRAGVTTLSASTDGAARSAQALLTIGSEVSITLTANPTRVTAGQASSLGATVSRADGSPVASGTEIRFSTNRGSLDSTSVSTGAGGIASTTLRTSAGDQGSATVTATLPGLGVSATTTVVIE